MFYWFLKNLVIGPFAFSVFRPWVRGRENVPETGAVIYASNHLSFIDSVFLPLVVDRPISFLAKSDYFTGKGFKGAIMRWFFLAIHQLPIDRSGGKASEASLNSGLEHLANGGQLGIYPEGTRSPDGRLYRGRTGVARMILEAGVPGDPGRDDRHREGHADRHQDPEGAPRRRRLRRAARLLALRRAWRATASCCARSPTRSCTSSSQLSGQEYVDVYASSIKREKPVKKRRRSAPSARRRAAATV